MEEAQGGKKKVIVLGILIAMVVLFIIGYAVRGRQAGGKIIVQGDRAPEFSLRTADGRPVSLASLRGKVVMLHFWATWCPPCVEEIPTLDKLYRMLAGPEFEMLAVSVDEGGPAVVADFMKKNGLNVPVLFDPDKAVSSRYGTFKFPETYILDRNGIVAVKVIGPRNWTDPNILQGVKAIIGK